MRKLLIVLCIISIFAGIIHVPYVSAGTVTYKKVECSEYAYTYKDDPNQTTQKINGRYTIRDASNYNANTPADVIRGLYTKYDISEYIENGYTIQKAEYLMKFVPVSPYTLKLALVDCPANDIKTGTTNYSTAPATGELIQTVAGINGSVPLTGYTDIPNDWNFAGDITDYINGKVSLGQYSFTIAPLYWYVGDVHIVELPVLYITLNKAPEVDIISPESENATVDIDNSFEFKARVVSEGGTVDFYIDDKKIEIDPTVSDDIYYSITVPANTINTTGLHTLKVIATDSSGVHTIKTRTINCISNYTFPEVEIISPAVDSELDFRKPFEFSARATDADGIIVRVDFYADDKKIDTATQVNQEGIYSITVPLNTINKGTHVLKVIAFDNTNRGTPSTVNVTGISTNKVPIAEIISPDGNASIDFTEPFEFKAKVTDSDGSVTSVDFYVDGKIINNQYTVTDNVYYQITVPAYTISRSGDYQLKVIATDDLGEISEEATLNVNCFRSKQTIIMNSIDNANIRYNDPNQRTCDEYTNYWISGFRQDGSPDRALLLKYNIARDNTNVFDIKKDIKKVELIFKIDTKQIPGNIDFYEISDNSWPSNVNCYEMPEHNSSPFASTPIYIKSGYKLYGNGYEVSSNSEYTAAVDITDFALSKVEKGLSEFSVFMSSTNEIRLCMKLPVLYISYTDNTRPSVSITAPLCNGVARNEDLTFSANVNDLNGTISSTVFKFDGVEYGPAAKEGDIYTVVIPAAKVTEGAHDLEVTAVDNQGARFTVSEKRIAKSYIVNNMKLSGVNGGEVIFQAGSIVYSSVDITNVESENMTATAAIALYDENNTMRAFGFNNIVLQKGTRGNVSTSLKIPAKVGNIQLDITKCIIKAYIWTDIIEENSSSLDSMIIKSATE